MNTTPYTDDQILEALEKAFAFTGVNKFTTTNERLQIGKKFLELLPKSQPILADDGRSLEQVAIQEHEKAPSGIKWFAAANAVATVVITRAVQRIEAVTEKELHDQYWKGQTYVGTSQAIERIRAHLIAAVKGEGQAMTKNVPGDKCPACGAEEVESNTPNTVYACGSSDYDGRPETFHPGDQCDSRGEAKQSEAVADDPYATLKAYAKAGARIRFEDEFGWSEWAANEDWSWTQPPEEYQVHPADLHLLQSKTFTFAGLEWNKHTPGDPMPCEPEALVQVTLERELDGRDEWRDETDLAREYDWGVETDEWFPIVGWRYADEPDKTWTPENAKAFEDFQAELRETWDTQHWTPKPGDVVQLKSGGPRMTCILRHAHQDTYLCTWTSDYGVFERFFPLACLQQA